MSSSVNTHQQLTNWVVQNGGYLHPDVEIICTPDRGFHVLVSHGKTIAAMTRIASCPMTAALSVLNAKDIEPFGCQGTRFPRPFLHQDVAMVQAFFLMEQFVLGDRSWWAPYIATLPTPRDVHDLSLTAQADLAWIDGTNFKAALLTQTDKWQGLYTSGLDQLKRLKWHSAIQNLYSWELFQWAATIFGSRSFTSLVLKDTLPAARASPMGCYYVHGKEEDLTRLFEEGFPVLLPLLDLLNHKPRARVEWQARYSFVGLQVLDTFEDGQEVCNNYGPRDNETLMLGYGFTMEENPFDHYSVALKVTPGSPLADARKWTPDIRSDGSYRCYVFNTQHPQALSSKYLEFALFSYDLFDSLSVLSGNDREVQTIYMVERTLMSSGLKNEKFEDYRNVLSTISQLLSECQARNAVISRSNPTQEPSSQKQKYAHIYRSSQSSILQTAVVVAKFILIRAASIKSNDVIIDTLRNSEGASLSAISNLELLLRRHSILTIPEELLSVNGLLDLMSRFEGLRVLVDRVRGTIGDKITTESLAKCQLAVILGALQVEFQRGNVLPRRLQLWLDQLTQWYPPDDQHWSYVPHEGPYQPGEEPPTMLMPLLQACKTIRGTNHINASLQDDQSASSESETSSSSSGRVQNHGTSSRLPMRWTKPEVICWGFNVMWEEGVRVPLQIVEEDCQAAESSSFLLYCPQVQ